MTTPQAKRRRLNEATLRKPFKSPFRTPRKDTSSSEPPSSDPPVLHTSTLASSSTPQVTPKVVPRPASVLDIVAFRRNHPTPTASVQKKSNSQASLTREIMHMRNDIQILNQAHSLATSSKEENLLILIDRWRTASRAAAEEVFAGTRDRVNRMGGVGAWREREKERSEWRKKADREEMDAERERWEEAKEKGEVCDEVLEYYENADGEPSKEDDISFSAADDDSFTMDLMLKTLNIDLKLIGYSKEAQRWDG